MEEEKQAFSKNKGFSSSMIGLSLDGIAWRGWGDNVVLLSGDIFPFRKILI